MGVKREQAALRVCGERSKLNFGKPWKLSYLSMVEASGISSVAVECVDIRRNTSGEGDDLAHN